jgi:hypothetical protein
MNHRNFVAGLAATISLSALLGGCGMAETTAVTAAQAEAAVEAAKEGEKTKAKVEQDIAAAQSKAAEARAAADEE